MSDDVEDDDEEADGGGGGPWAILSWMLANIVWASDRLPDCRASDRLCRSLLNGSLLWPPFCDETSFCSAVRAVWASEVLPDCRALLRVFIRVEMSVEELSEEELSWGGGGGGGPWDCICCPTWASMAEESICEKISSTLELLWELLDDDVLDEEVLDEEALDLAAWLSSYIISLISFCAEALNPPPMPLIELVIS